MPSGLSRQVAFIVGRVLHQGTRLPIPGRVQIAAAEGAVFARVLEDGTFGVSGDLAQLFPDLSLQPYSLSLTFKATSAQFRLGSVIYRRSITVPAGSDFDPDLAATPPSPLIDLGTIYLPVNPIDDPTADLSVYQENLKVVIRGQVIQAEQPETAFVTPPTIEILQSGVPTLSATADANGRYELSEIGVRSPARIRCAVAGFQTVERSLWVDYSKVFNQENFQLLPVPSP